MKKFIILALFLLTPILLAGQTSESAYKVKKKAEAPVFASPEEEKLYHLRKGHVFTDGGYLKKKGVWGSMEGVIQAPPKVVWRLFLQADEWRGYRLPQLLDSRAVSEEVAGQSVPLKKVDDFYELLGDRVFDPIQNQKSGTVWTNHTFQYYDVPWPVSNKWMVLKNQNDETEGSKGIYHCRWERMGGNLRSLNGEFLLKPFDGDPKQTLMFYRVETDPGSGVPRFLLKWGVKKSLPAAMRVIRREAVRLYGRPSPILKTQ